MGNRAVDPRATLFHYSNIPLLHYSNDYGHKHGLKEKHVEQVSMSEPAMAESSLGNGFESRLRPG